VVDFNVAFLSVHLRM